MIVMTRLAVALCFVAIFLRGGTGHAASVEQVPWAVPSDIVVERREITVENQGARLAGTLFLPAGRTPSVKAALPGADGFWR